MDKQNEYGHLMAELLLVQNSKNQCADGGVGWSTVRVGEV